MSDSKNYIPNEIEPGDPAGAQPQRGTVLRRESMRWWLKLIVQPLLFLIVGVALIAGLGIAQRWGWLASGGSSSSKPAVAADKGGTKYICPMMCTPPLSEPGRCPVCGMELVATNSGGGDGDSRAIQIDPVARRVAHIQTTAVESVPMTRTIQAIGQLHYDEGSMKTISAYVDGRIERLFADYTGVVVQKGDRLALLYSPRLYSGQVELLLAKKARDNNQHVTMPRVVGSNQDLYDSAKQRLIDELGMTEPQIEELERSGVANSRSYIHAPISGTVILKNAVEGEYIKEGQPIYQLADLSEIWLMLELFPEDAASIRYGQVVETHVQSLPNQAIAGRVAFVDPNVDPKTRTVGVRVIVPNERGVLRVGDYANATISVVLSNSGNGPRKVYDPELAGKWISPRHPNVIESEPGLCRVCGVQLTPASEYGFSEEPIEPESALVVPRNAVLMAGDHSVLYVETEPGRFEIRRVVLGPSVDDRIVILEGVQEGEQVAVSGNFLIDSQMQLAGNPSLIDPTKAEAIAEAVEPTGHESGLAALPDADRRLAELQGVCPVSDSKLGSMGPPLKVDVSGREVFICCEGCRATLLADPERYLAKLANDPAGK